MQKSREHPCINAVRPLNFHGTHERNSVVIHEYRWSRLAARTERQTADSEVRVLGNARDTRRTNATDEQHSVPGCLDFLAATHAATGVSASGRLRTHAHTGGRTWLAHTLGCKEAKFLDLCIPFGDGGRVCFDTLFQCGR